MSLDERLRSDLSALRTEPPEVAASLDQVKDRGRRRRRRRTTLRSVGAVAVVAVVAGVALLLSSNRTSTLHVVGPGPANPTATTDGTRSTTTNPTTASTATAADVQDLAVTDALRSQLTDAYSAFTTLPRAEIAGTRAGSVYYAYQPSTSTYWALATFSPTPEASQRTLVAMQDGGEIGVFTRSAGGAWTMTSVGGLPFPCPGVLPPAVQARWGLATATGC